MSVSHGLAAGTAAPVRSGKPPVPTTMEETGLMPEAINVLIAKEQETNERDQQAVG